jgi:hypothetical protein
MDSPHEIQPLASKFISGSLMSKYSTSYAAALTTKIRFPETSEVSPPQIGKRQRMKQQNLEWMLSKTS